MTKLFFDDKKCEGVTSGYSGRTYTANDGFINVSDSRDAAFLKANGYLEAGGMPVTSKWWECENCSFSAVINHCPKCGSESLTKVEK